jgi:hypothetical protein
VCLLDSFIDGSPFAEWFDFPAQFQNLAGTTMGTCLFVAAGDDFRMDEFLKSSSIRSMRVFHKGDIQPKDNPLRERRPDSGFALLVSDDPDQEDLSGQIPVVLDFLLKNKEEILWTRKLGAEDHLLDFGFVPGQGIQSSVHLPPNLIMTLGLLDLGIVFSVIQLPRG